MGQARQECTLKAAQQTAVAGEPSDRGVPTHLAEGKAETVRPTTGSRPIPSPLAAPSANVGHCWLLATPETKKRSIHTPPSTPRPLQTRKSSEIDAALVRGSMPLLSLALLRGHRCGSDHGVHEAVRLMSLPALELLLRHDQDPDEHCCGQRALHLALQACMAENDVGYRMADILLRHHARPDPVDGDGRHVEGPLHGATKRGCAAAVSLLLKRGADPNGRDGNGNSPLHILCRQMHIHIDGGYRKVLDLLLQAGAKPYILDADGRPPIAYAHWHGLRWAMQRAEHSWSAGALAAAQGRRPWLLPEIARGVLRFL
jgi:hypothetical protein